MRRRPPSILAVHAAILLRADVPNSPLVYVSHDPVCCWEISRGRMLKLLLLAGADQTIAGNDRRTPRAIKWIYGRPACGKVFTVSGRGLG